MPIAVAVAAALLFAIWWNYGRLRAGRGNFLVSMRHFGAYSLRATRCFNVSVSRDLEKNVVVRRSSGLTEVFPPHTLVWRVDKNGQVRSPEKLARFAARMGWVLA